MSLDKKLFYVFGGSHDSVESMELQKPDSWRMLDVKFPKGIKFEGGLTMLPMWHYCQKLENIS